MNFKSVTEMAFALGIPRKVIALKPFTQLEGDFFKPIRSSSGSAR